MRQFPRLSNREMEVVKLLLKGKSNKLIALDMKVTERTVEFHLKNIYSKFEVSSRMELVLSLKNDRNWLESEILGYSTVAGKRNFAENGDGLNLSDWVTSLRKAVSKIGKELIMNVPSDSSTNSETSPITFFESIRKCLTKYAEFNGRASRSEFWWFALFIVICVSAFTLINDTIGEVFLLATLLPLLAAGSRRLHDSGKSAWQLLYLLVPVAGIVILGILWAEPSTDSLSEKDTLPA
jgi:DNA-binding CsgD family transcriptional regulator